MLALAVLAIGSLALYLPRFDNTISSKVSLGASFQFQYDVSVSAVHVGRCRDRQRNDAGAGWFALLGLSFTGPGLLRRYFKG
jgi:hypothetical protein